VGKNGKKKLYKVVYSTQHPCKAPSIETQGLAGDGDFGYHLAVLLLGSKSVCPVWSASKESQIPPASPFHVIGNSARNRCIAPIADVDDFKDEVPLPIRVSLVVVVFDTWCTRGRGKKKEKRKKEKKKVEND